MEFLNKLENTLVDNGFTILGNINIYSDKFQRFRDANNPKKGKNIFIKVIGNCEGAIFGDWRDKENYILWWKDSFKKLTHEELADREQARAAIKQKEREERMYAMKRAHMLWDFATKQSQASLDNHDYVLAKHIKALYSRRLRSRLVIPIYNTVGQIQSLQFIAKNGRKRFKRGATFKGGYLLLGEHIANNDVIRICEGWSTGCSIYEAVGAPVVVAFNADNLLSVALNFRSKYPSNIIHICGDDDFATKENAGKKYGRLASEASGAKLVFPMFYIEHREIKNTDFNDLLNTCGLEEVEKQLLTVC